MSAKHLRIAMLGTGFMGRAHSNAWLNVGKFFDLKKPPIMDTASGPFEDELIAFADRWGWKNMTTDWRLACDNEEIDLIDIGTPNHVHREQAVYALEAGRNVLCEKPLAGTLDEAREMVNAAKNAKKSKTFVSYSYRRCPAVALAHQMVKQGKLGRIYHVRAAFLQDWGGPDTPLIWRFQGKVAGSGALGDLCAHSIDAARFITGDEISEITGARLETFIKERAIIEEGGGAEISGKGAQTAKKMGKSTVDDAVVAIGRTKGGALATFEASRLSTGYKNANRIEVHGEKGAIRFDFERMNELDYYDATAEPAVQGWANINVTQGGAGHPYADAWWPDAHILGYEHSFVNQAADICRVLAGRKPLVPLADFADAFKTQCVVEAIVQSAKNKCPIKLSQIK